jgi:predicted ATPase
MPATPIRTPDYRLRVFVSSTLGELSTERAAVRQAIERMHLAPVMFELGARPHPPRALYRTYLAQSHIFIGIYWQRYGWVAPGETISGLEDEYRLAGDRPRLLYIKHPAPEREERLSALLREFQTDDQASYKRIASVEELSTVVQSDLALLLSERFAAAVEADSRERPRASDAPAPLTRTVGRRGDLDRIVAKLDEGHRLVTLTGPGGVGKTRLAQEAAARLRSRYPDGVHFVPLDTVTEGSLLGRSICDRLGIRTEGNWTAQDALVDRFAGRDALLMLDNIEQIADVERPLRGLLERIPDLTILTTSRRALRIAGEQEIAVAPLAIPDPGQPLASLAHEPAIQLFADRARDADSRFALEGETVRQVAEICRRLDGLPLAIELAATRSRLLRPAVLLARLDQGFDLLRSRVADLPERQRTIRATLEWSHQLLEAKERALLACLGIFAGGFSLEAAEAVCDPDGALEFLDSLTALLDNSLVLVADDRDLGQPRFRMLETVRAFAFEQLKVRDEAGPVSQRHLAWYRRLSAEARPSLCGPNQTAWAVRLDPERANFRKAVQSSFELDDLEGVVELAWDLAVFYEIRDASDEPRDWMRRVTARNPKFDGVMRAKLLSIDALLRVQAGDYGGAREALEWSLSVFRSNALPFQAAVTLMVLSDVHFGIDHDPARAVATLEESTRLFESVDHEWGVARTEIMLATMLWSAGDHEDAERHLRRSLDHSRQIENEPQIARALSLLAMLAKGRSPSGSAMPLLREAGEIVARGRYRTEATFFLAATAGALLERGDAQGAAETISMSESVRDGLGVRFAPILDEFVDSVSSVAARATSNAGRADPQPHSVFDYVTEVLERMTARG